MSHLQFYSYKGVGEYALEHLGYRQSVRVGDRIECSGQGGWKTEGPELEFPQTLEEEIDQAFKNCEVAVKDAGGKGWSQVYRVNSYHLPLNEEALGLMTKAFKKWMPDHAPIWTATGTPALGDPRMHVEIEVTAHAPNSK